MAEEEVPKNYREYRALIEKRKAAQAPLEPLTAEQIEQARRESNRAVAEGFAED